MFNPVFSARRLAPLCSLTFRPLCHPLTTIKKTSHLERGQDDGGMEEVGGGRGEIMNTQEVSSALVDRAGIIRLNLYSGQGAFHRGGREGGKEGYLSFPSCTSSRTQIGTEGWAVSPGISVLPFVPTPSEGNLPADLHSQRPLCVSEHEPGSPRESNPPSPPLPPPTHPRPCS